MHQLLNRAFWIGPKFLAGAAASLPTMLTLYWMPNAGSSGEILLYLLFLICAALMAAALGAAAALVLFPTAQFALSASRVPQSAWPLGHALICGALCGGGALGYCIWVYGSFARVLAVVGRAEVGIILWGSTGAGLVAGFLFGAAMRDFSNKNDEMAREPA